VSSERSAVAQLVITAVVRTFRVVDPASIDEQTTAQDVDGWDSLSHTMLLMEIETQLRCDLPLDEIYLASNVGELVDIATRARSASQT